MRSVLSRLFGTQCPQPRRRESRRLGFDSLESRLVPAVAAGTEFHVNSVTAGDQTHVAVASNNGQGKSIAVWASPTTGKSLDIKAQRYKDDVKFGGEIIIASTTNNEQQPAVAMDLFGDFVVVWTEYSQSTSDIRAGQFAWTGERLDSVNIAADAGYYEFDPSIANIGSGNFVVSYTRQQGSSTSAAMTQDIVAKVFRNTMTLASTVTVASTLNHAESKSSVGAVQIGSSNDTRFAVAYTYNATEGTVNAANNNVMLKQFRMPTGISTAVPTLVKYSTVAGTSANENDASVAVDKTGGAIVAYSSGTDIFVKRFASNGDPAKTVLVTIANSSTSEISPSVSYNQFTGGYLVAFQASTVIKVAQVSSSNKVTSTVKFGSGVKAPVIAFTNTGDSKGKKHFFVAYLSTATRSNDAGTGVFGTIVTTTD